jgi:hypothetical protein
MDFQEMCESKEWIEKAQERVQLEDFMNTAMELQVL